jgi:hypothetical protein
MDGCSASNFFGCFLEMLISADIATLELAKS